MGSNINRGGVNGGDISDILRLCKHTDETHEMLEKVARELHGGICFTRTYNEKSVTFFGSARFKEGNVYYEKARELAKKIVSELGYSVISGGGGGIMEGANRGAYEAGGRSVGYTISLPNEQKTNPFVKDEVFFRYFFTRKVSLVYSAEAFVFFPGGFGTLDEFFEVVTLIQTGKIARVPVVAFGGEYWSEIDRFAYDVLENRFKTISPGDRNIYTITDNMDEVVEIVRNATIRNGAQDPF